MVCCLAADPGVRLQNQLSGSGICLRAVESIVWHQNHSSGIIINGLATAIICLAVIYVVRQQNQLSGSGICYLLAEPVAWQQKHLSGIIISCLAVLINYLALSGSDICLLSSSILAAESVG